jgi:hypothetical protein
MPRERLRGPVVVRPAQRELKARIVGREAGLQRERREDDLARDAVALLVADPLVDVEVADDGVLQLGSRH